MSTEAADGTGLVLLRASHLEALVHPLQQLLHAACPNNPLAAQPVIAAHPGMQQWLVRALARDVGPGRIVANLDVQLPNAWLDRLATRTLGQRATTLAHYRKPNLRWTLHRLLDGNALPPGVTDPRITEYLHAADDTLSADVLARRRFQLADHLAGILTQYLVYRPDWLAAWEAGKFRFATAQRDDPALARLEAELLAPLWHDVHQQLGAHRGNLVQALVGALEQHPDELEPLHVFGVAHLPRATLDVLRAYALHAQVTLYLPDPCREYWAGLFPAHALGTDRAVPDREDWDAYAARESDRLATDAVRTNLWQDQRHPLLAHWGRLGQHFFAALADVEAVEDLRHARDEANEAPTNRLERLQASIRRLDPALMAEDAVAPEGLTDTTLRIHACHTRLRELEVLHDALLDALANDNVQPGNMVVMAPDIHAYLPLIPSVFGTPDSAREHHLPYHLADIAVTRSHPLLQTFTRLLDLPTSRITAPEVADLLAVPAITNRLGLDADDIDTLIEWLRQSQASWSLGPAHKRAWQVPPTSEGSFAWALDRMLAGYVMADTADAEHAEAVELPDATRLLPITGISGPPASALGGLWQLLHELAQWLALASDTLPASAWTPLLHERVDAMFRPEYGDRQARDALSAIHRAIGNVTTEPAGNDEDPELAFAVVRDLLTDTLDAVPERQRFLLGGVTFCGMVPQRAIPFDVVCVLGLNEREFPRTRADAGLDLMTKLHRIGDRDTASDDRYLFLETLMSARKRLHLSYIGQDMHDGKARNPAAPLAELLAELGRHAQHAADADPDDPPRPWLVRHPLQPFDPRYFNASDPRLFSYAARFAGLATTARKPLPAFTDGPTPPSGDLPTMLPLRSLESYYKDPACEVLRERIQLSLDGIDPDANLPDAEPLEGIAPIHTVARKVFFADALPQLARGETWNPDPPPAWVALSGILPDGKAGRDAWCAQAEAVTALVGVAQDSQRFDASAADSANTVPIDIELAPTHADEPAMRVFGTISNVFPLADATGGLQLVKAFPSPQKSGQNKRKKKPDTPLKKGAYLTFKELVPAFVQWALLRLETGAADATHGPAHPVRLTLLADGAPDVAVHIDAWDAVYCDADDTARKRMRNELVQRVRSLIDLWHRAGTGAVCYYPKTASAALSAWQKTQPQLPIDELDGVALEDITTAIEKAWESTDYHTGERDYAPGYARALAGAAPFDPDSATGRAALRDLLATADKLQQLMQLPLATKEPA